MTPVTDAFILAAGKGTRLRPLTDACPKPLVPVNGVPMIDSAIDKLAAAGVTDITVNLHYRGDQLAGHLAARYPGESAMPRIHLSREDKLLDTGGGIKQGLKTINSDPFYIVSGDSLWEDDRGVGRNDPALTRLARAWDEAAMDCLILLQPVESMSLTRGVGDYDLDAEGRAIRSRDKTGAYMWTSIRLCARRLFDDTPGGAFSFLTLLDRAEAAGRLYGLVHEGRWHHISTPEDHARVEAARAAPPGAHPDAS